MNIHTRVAWIEQRWRKVNQSISGTNKFWRRSPTTIQRYKSVDSILKEYSKGTIIDIGSANAVFRESIPQGVQYVSCDYDETKERYHKNQLDSFMCDVQAMPSEDMTYETVLCTEVLEHVPRPHEGAKEIVRILKPGGVAIISVPFMGYYHNVPHDFYRFTKYGLRQMFDFDDVEVVHEESLGGFFSFIGYVRSTALLVLFYSIPVIGQIVFWLNYVLAHIDILLDKAFSTKKIVPVTNVLVIRKKG